MLKKSKGSESPRKSLKQEIISGSDEDTRVKLVEELNSDQDSKTGSPKKSNKKLNSQRFTVETTVTIKNEDNKKGKKARDSHETSSPEAKRKSRNSWKN